MFGKMGKRGWHGVSGPFFRSTLLSDYMDDRPHLALGHGTYLFSGIHATIKTYWISSYVVISLV
jgi:hypothetical protein